MGLFAKSGSAKASMGMKLGAKLIGEMLSDLKDSEVPAPIMEIYMKQLSAVISWCATGEKDPDLPWPPDFEV